MKTIDYCRALKKQLGISSDYELAKRLGVTRQSVSNYVNGLRAFDTTTAAKVAELLELDPITVIADAELERGTNDALWKRIRAAAAIVAGVGTCTLAVQFARSSGADLHQVTEAFALLASAPGGLSIMSTNTWPGPGGAVAIALSALVAALLSRGYKALSLSLRPA